MNSRLGIIFWLLSSSIPAAPPLDIPLRVTGSFGEFRNDHLHAGIDFGTQSSTGHNVFAIKKGWVYRIKKRSTGEGNTIYLKHEDGTISVYAHLEDFVPKIESLADKAEPYDLFPKQKLHFLEGDIIGFSGESGRGFPHLHFEMRSSMVKALKQSMFLEGISDTKKPELKSIKLVPFLQDQKPISVPVESKKEIQIAHAVGIAVEAFDQIDNSHSRCHVPEWRVFDGDSLIYHSKMDTLSHNRNYASAMHFLRDSTNLSPTIYVYKLYQDFTQTSPFIVKTRGNGVLGPGLHHIRIEAEDFYGNTSHTSLRVRVTGSELKQLKSYSKKLEFQEGPFKLSLLKEGVSSDTQPELTLNQLPTRFIGVGVIGLKISPSYLFFTQKAKLHYLTPIDGKEYFLRWNPIEHTWKSIPFKKSSSSIETQISFNGKFLVARDLKPPTVDSKINILKARRKTFFYIEAKDDESGIDEQSLQFQCSNSSIQAEFDTDRNWIRWSSENCSAIRLKICDNVGNCSAKLITVNSPNE